MKKSRIGLALISDPKHVFYFSDVSTSRSRPFNLLLLPGKESIEPILITGRSEEKSARSVFENTILTYEDYDLQSRMVADQEYVAAQLKKTLHGLKERLGSVGSVGVENWHLGGTFAENVVSGLSRARLKDISPLIMSMRRTKGSDELAYHRAAAARIDRAYEVAKKKALEGVSEIGIYSAVNSSFHEKEAYPEFWEHSNVTGDYISGERSLEAVGWPSARRFQRGDTLILDLQTMYKYHWADTARSFVIGAQPSSRQSKIHETLVKAKQAAESLLKPGTSSAKIYSTVSEVLKDAGLKPLPHHAGHGIGLDSQEPPYFIPVDNDETLLEGDVCAIEPGAYDKEAGGLRIEDNYVITSDGYEKLSDFPLTL